MRRTPVMTPEEKNAAYQKWWDSRERCPNCGGLLYHYYRTDNQSITGGVVKPPEGARYLADRCMGKGGWDREAYAATESRAEADKPTTEPCGWMRVKSLDPWTRSELSDTNPWYNALTPDQKQLITRRITELDDPVHRHVGDRCQLTERELFEACDRGASLNELEAIILTTTQARTTQLAAQALKPGPYAGRYDEF